LTLPPGATDARRVGGGDSNDAYRVRLRDGTDAFVKTRADPQPGEYEAEARGLRWLAEAGALRTPRVLDVSEDYLALEWVQPGALDAAGAEQLGRGLALTHAAGAASFGDARGRGDPAQLGALQLPNGPSDDWPGFYADARLRPLAREARQRGRLPATGEAAVERVCERIHDLAGPPEPPARLHGDLWSGNVLADEHGAPWLIDPCAYGGHREVDLAMLLMFGAPPARTIAAYEDVTPLAAGWRERTELYQLLPLLVHAALFGGGYSSSAERSARRLAG
jgi:fructosamine-3-kinase